MSSAYAVYGDIASEFKQGSFTASSIVTSTQVTQFITEASAYMDGRISNKYSTPITGTASLIILKTICIMIVADRVRKILEVKTGDSNKDSNASKGEKGQAEKMLDMIVKGDLPFLDSTLASSDDGSKGYTYDNSVATSFNVESDSW